MSLFDIAIEAFQSAISQEPEIKSSSYNSYEIVYVSDTKTSEIQLQNQEKAAQYSIKVKELKYEKKNISRAIKMTYARQRSLRDDMYSYDRAIAKLRKRERGIGCLFSISQDLAIQVFNLREVIPEVRRRGKSWVYVAVFVPVHVISEVVNKASLLKQQRMELYKERTQISNQIYHLGEDIDRLERKGEKIGKKKKKAKKKKKNYLEQS
jgi:prefoldin subunit 5